MSLIKFYDTGLRKRPVLTKMVTNGVICFTGDAICQGLERCYRKRDEPFNLLRSMRQSAVGAFLVTTSLHYYLKHALPYIQFSKATFANTSMRNLANIILRVSVHTTVLTPVRLTLFFLGMGTLEHLSFKAGI